MQRQPDAERRQLIGLRQHRAQVRREQGRGGGKIRVSADPVKVCADVTIVFRLIVLQAFAKDVDDWKESTKDCVCWLEDKN